MSQDLTGLWIGSIYNDTTQQSLFYEVAIGETNGKLIAYSYTTFIVNNQPAIGIKSIKVVKQDNTYFFEDNELLYNNYPVEPPKGVKQISALSFNNNSDGSELSGKFITTRTKKYGRQVTGMVNLRRKPNYQNDKMIAVLERLDLAKSLSFYKVKSDTPEMAEKKKTKVSRNLPTFDSLSTAQYIYALPEKPNNPLEELSKREVNTIETVFFTSDSLQLILYDNGYVDGDSVSIVLDGKLIMEHQRLSQMAITKTIASATDSMKLIMYAENLGSIAPNTGLLIINDGNKRHEIRFEGDLQKNAAVILRRKRR